MVFETNDLLAGHPQTCDRGCKGSPHTGQGKASPNCSLTVVRSTCVVEIITPSLKAWVTTFGAIGYDARNKKSLKKVSSDPCFLTFSAEGMLSQTDTCPWQCCSFGQLPTCVVPPPTYAEPGSHRTLLESGAGQTCKQLYGEGLASHHAGAVL